MATPTRLAPRPKARQAAPEAPADRFEAFVTALEDSLVRRQDAAPVDSQWAAALFDVLMAVKAAAREARK